MASRQLQYMVAAISTTVGLTYACYTYWRSREQNQTQNTSARQQRQGAIKSTDSNQQKSGQETQTQIGVGNQCTGGRTQFEVKNDDCVNISVDSSIDADDWLTPKQNTPTIAWPSTSHAGCYSYVPALSHVSSSRPVTTERPIDTRPVDAYGFFDGGVYNDVKCEVIKFVKFEDKLDSDKISSDSDAESDSINDDSEEEMKVVVERFASSDFQKITPQKSLPLTSQKSRVYMKDKLPKPQDTTETEFHGISGLAALSATPKQQDEYTFNSLDDLRNPASRPTNNQSQRTSQYASKYAPSSSQDLEFDEDGFVDLDCFTPSPSTASAVVSNRNTSTARSTSSERTSIAEGEEESKNCSVCGSTEKLFKCSRCKIMLYCSKEHQKLHWKYHKATCHPSPKNTDSTPSKPANSYTNTTNAPPNTAAVSKPPTNTAKTAKAPNVDQHDNETVPEFSTELTGIATSADTLPKELPVPNQKVNVPSSFAKRLQSLVDNNPQAKHDHHEFQVPQFLSLSREKRDDMKRMMSDEQVKQAEAERVFKTAEAAIETTPKAEEDSKESVHELSDDEAMEATEEPQDLEDEDLKLQEARKFEEAADKQEPSAPIRPDDLPFSGALNAILFDGLRAVVSEYQ